MRIAIVVLAFVVACVQMPHVVDRVTVRGPNFEVVRTIDDPASLTRFAELWRTRQKTKAGPTESSEYPFKLDIAANYDSGRWLYHPDGFTKVLSATSGNVYLVDDVAAFNAVLGLAGDSEVETAP